MSTARTAAFGADAGTTAGREPALDGIRGLAILLVLVHHVVIYAGIARDNVVDRAVVALGASAWLGVDLFFVLSGFLITGILYDARSSSRYYSSFYGRRVVRIFPLYYGFLALVFVVLPAVFPNGWAASSTNGQGWYWLYLSNVQVAHSGWQEPLHLGHFWSLAVEEQFYLLWPFVVRSCGRRRLMQVTVGCMVSAFAVRAIAPYVGLSALGAFVLLPTRIDSLAAGALLALASREAGSLESIRRWSPHVLAGCLLAAAVLFAWRRGFGEGDRVIVTAGLSVFAVGFAALVALAASSPSGSFVRRWAAAGPLVMLGQYSYGLYVFHQPVAIVLRDAGLQADIVSRLGGSQLPGLAVFGVAVGGISLACAVASWHAWEQPFLRLKRYMPYQPTPVSGHVGMPSAYRASSGAEAAPATALASRDARLD
jgi:peptidoglycan/LPS O-acetylase OafA/YrhL